MVHVSFSNCFFIITVVVIIVAFHFVYSTDTSILLIFTASQLRQCISNPSLSFPPHRIQAKFKEDQVPCTIRFQHDPRSGGHASSPVCRRKGSNMHIVIIMTTDSNEESSLLKIN